MYLLIPNVLFEVLNWQAYLYTLKFEVHGKGKEELVWSGCEGVYNFRLEGKVGAMVRGGG
jgi:hypothetical protein